MLDSDDLRYLAVQIDGLEDTVDALSLQSNANIVYEYHHHADKDGNLYPNDSEVLYTVTEPGGCFVASGHTHDKTDVCPVTESISWKEGCNDKGWAPRNHAAGYNPDGSTIWACRVCGSTNPHGAGLGGWCKDTGAHAQITHVKNCGNQPVNTYKIGCHRRENEIVSATVEFSPSGS